MNNPLVAEDPEPPPLSTVALRSLCLRLLVFCGVFFFCPMEKAVISLLYSYGDN